MIFNKMMLKAGRANKGKNGNTHLVEYNTPLSVCCRGNWVIMTFLTLINCHTCCWTLDFLMGLCFMMLVPAKHVSFMRL